MIESADKKGIDLEEFLKGSWQEFKTTNDIREKLFPIFFNEFTEYVPVLANFYMKEVDSELIVEQISEKTTDWIAQWSYELSDLMHLSSHEEIENILVKGLKNGKGISETARDVLESGIRDEFYKARRAALTETLRAHSFAREESIQQCPASEYKEWIHTGNHKIEPRPNHVKFSGTIVSADKSFMLECADGKVRSADFPKDPALPAAEVINCHCIHRSITSEEILGLPLEERKKLQQQAIDEMGDEWKKELDARNNDADLERLYKTVDTKYGPRKVFKSLTELKNDGIMTVPHETLRHSTVGDYIKPSKDYPNGRLKNGGHSQKCIEELKNKGIDYKITKKYNNGVRLGYVPEHKQKTKQSGIGQSWFPENWDDNDILKAGTYTANHSKDSGMPKFAEYNGVRVGIFLDNDGFPSTIFPDNSEQP